MLGYYHALLNSGTWTKNDAIITSAAASQKAEKR